MTIKKITIAIAAILTTFTAIAQDIAGPWYGELKIPGGQLRIVFNVIKTGDSYTATMDSPDQGAKGIPVAATTYTNHVLTFKMPNAGITYEGTFDDREQITGTFTQGQSVQMNLTRKKIEDVPKPQDPKRPYPYNSEDIIFNNAKAGITLAGTLTLPKTGGSFPAVVLISGSGAQNRDEELLGHKPFLVLADHLTKAGIAVLRFDDRGTNASGGKFKGATSADFATDVEAAIQYLEGRSEINKKKIGLIGHSEGGIIAPMVAARSIDVAFIVLLAGPGIPGSQIIILQEELGYRAAGTPEAEVQKIKALRTGVMDIATNRANDDTLATRLSAYFKQALADNPAYAKMAGQDNETLIRMQTQVLTDPWFNYFIKYDPAPALQKVKCPILALIGEKDRQVPSQINLNAIKAALTRGGNKHFTVKEMPGLNHLFQESTLGTPAEYAKIEQTFSPAALAEVSKWVLGVVK